MRINKYLAQSTRLSRRSADTAVSDGRVCLNGRPATPGDDVKEADVVTLDNRTIAPLATTTTIMLNKPAGYVVSRDGQGSLTIYNILPPEYQSLNPVGRLDKDSSGLLLLTNDGQLAQELTHPKYQKSKIYQIQLNRPLHPEDRQKIEQGVKVEDYISQLQLKGSNNSWTVTMSMGRNRQIRHTFEALGYRVTSLHRTQFGPHKIGLLKPAQTSKIK